MASSGRNRDWPSTWGGRGDGNGHRVGERMAYRQENGEQGRWIRAMRGREWRVAEQCRRTGEKYES